MFSARGSCLSLFFCVAVLPPASSLSRADDEVSPVSDSRPPQLTELVRQVIILAARDGYRDEKHWNKTSERFDGFRIRGLRISKRKREVRHGFCRKYAASFLAPERTLKLSISELQPPQRKEGTWLLMTADMRIRAEATFAHFIYGVKGVNGTTVADTDVRMRIVLSVDPHSEFSLAEPLPDFHLNAQVRDVDFWIKDVDVRKVGVFQGKFVEVLGDGLEEAIERLVQNQEAKVRTKLQKELDEFDSEDNHEAPDVTPRPQDEMQQPRPPLLTPSP